MVKTIYKYINESIDEKKLIEQLEIFAENNKEYKNSIEKLLKDIKCVVNNYKNSQFMKYEKIYDLLINNNVYLELANKMDDNDLMLMITDYISAKVVPALEQEDFDALVDAAIKSGKDSKENCWRLAMNYEYSGLNFDKIINYLISTKDAWYVSEFMHSLEQVVDLNNIVEKIIDTNDKKFMKNILNDNFAKLTLNENQIKKIKNKIDNN